MKSKKLTEKQLIEKRIKTDSLFKGHWIQVQCDTVKLHNNKLSKREFVLHPGAALIIPEIKKGELLFVKQFRYAVKKVFLEFPAGKKDKGETTLKAAKRELLEEVGYTAKEIKFVTKIHPVIGYANEEIDIYLARGLTYVGENPDDGEFLIPVCLNVHEAMKLVFEHKITDVKTQIALFWYERNFCG